MTQRYIYRLRQRTLIYVYTKLLRISKMPQSGEAPTSFVALMASNSSLNSGFSSRNEMFGLCAIVSKAYRSTSLVMLSSWSKWFANPSRISGFSCITVSPSRAVSCVAPSTMVHILLSDNYKCFHIVFICCLLQFFILCLPPLRLHFPGLLL